MYTPRPDRFTYPLHGDPLGVDATNDATAEKARQGEILPKKPWARVVFFGGLVGALLLGLVIGFTH